MFIGIATFMILLVLGNYVFSNKFGKKPLFLCSTRPVIVGFYFISFFFCNFRFECIPEILLENDPNGMKCKSCEHLNTKFHNLTPRLDENNVLWFKGEKYVVGEGVMLLPKSFDLAIRQKKGIIILSIFSVKLFSLKVLCQLFVNNFLIYFFKKRISKNSPRRR